MFSTIYFFISISLANSIVFFSDKWSFYVCTLQNEIVHHFFVFGGPYFLPIQPNAPTSKRIQSHVPQKHTERHVPYDECCEYES